LQDALAAFEAAHGIVLRAPGSEAKRE